MAATVLDVEHHTHVFLRAFPEIPLLQKEPLSYKINPVQMKSLGNITKTEPCFKHGDLLLMLFISANCSRCRKYVPLLRKFLNDNSVKFGGAPYQGAVKILVVPQDPKEGDFRAFFRGEDCGTHAEGWYAIDRYCKETGTTGDVNGMKTGEFICQQLSLRFGARQPGGVISSALPSMKLVRNFPNGNVMDIVKTVEDYRDLTMEFMPEFKTQKGMVAEFGAGIQGGSGGSCLDGSTMRALGLEQQVTGLPPFYSLLHAMGCGRVRVPIGSLVRICFLKAKAELNGKRGKIIGYQSRDRYLVEITGMNGETVAAKRSNLSLPMVRPDGEMTQLPNSAIYLVPLDNQRRAYRKETGNGQVLTNMDSADIPQPEIQACEDRELIKWIPGTYVVVEGLAAKPEYNGREGKIIEAPEVWHNKGGDANVTVGRYTVLLAGHNRDHGEILSLKPEKIWG